MSNIPTRRERRMAMKYQGILKAKSNATFSKWLEFTKSSIKNGIEIFKANETEVEKSVAEQLEAKELILIENWKTEGYNEAEIEKLREAYATLTIRQLSTWHTDKKIARNLIKEVNQSKAERVNG
jgi:hypothetical protein